MLTHDPAILALATSAAGYLATVTVLALTAIAAPPRSADARPAPSWPCCSTASPDLPYRTPHGTRTTSLNPVTPRADHQVIGACLAVDRGLGDR